jgi:hypothetical protein
LGEKETLLEAIRTAVNAAGGKWISKQQFLRSSGFKEADIFRYFPKWSDAVSAAGCTVEPQNIKIPIEDLLTDWGKLTRSLGRIPTKPEYLIQGNYSVMTFKKNFSRWSAIPEAFRDFAANDPKWSDVIALIPDRPNTIRMEKVTTTAATTTSITPSSRYQRLTNRPTYGNPIDFRGLRHEPVNENGVIFLFGIVARELGFLVEAVQAGFPDCEAKRQIAPGKWQRVRIEFEYESCNFPAHGHDVAGCDVIVCWRHNWAECPNTLEVVELCSLIQSLSASDG